MPVRDVTAINDEVMRAIAEMQASASRAQAALRAQLVEAKNAAESIEARKAELVALDAKVAERSAEATKTADAVQAAKAEYAEWDARLVKAKKLAEEFAKLARG
jgi:hypothetical protein